MRAVALFVVCGAGIAAAQPAPATGAASAEADQLFDLGRRQLAAGKIGEACAAFEASQRVSPLVTTLINLADCREKNGQLATAYGLFREVKRQTRAPTPEMTQLHTVAAEHIAALEPRLSKLTVSVERVPALALRRNGEPVELGTIGHALPIDGGTYTFTASAPGYEEATATVTVGAERDAKVVELPRLVARPVPPKPLVRSLVAPVVVGATALVLGGVAVGAELSARSSYDASLREPDDARQRELFSSAKTRRYVAQGLAVGGIAAAGVAVWLYVRGGKREVAPRVAVSLDATGVLVHGRF